MPGLPRALTTAYKRMWHKLVVFGRLEIQSAMYLARGGSYKPQLWEMCSAMRLFLLHLCNFAVACI